MDSIDWHASTARDDDIGEVSESAVKPLVVSLLPREGEGPSWRLYCTLRRLPFRARRWRRQATEVSWWKRRRLNFCGVSRWASTLNSQISTPSFSLQVNPLDFVPFFAAPSLSML